MPRYPLGCEPTAEKRPHRIGSLSAPSIFLAGLAGGRLQACAPPRTAPAGSSARDRTARSSSGPLGVRIKLRRRLPTAARASGARGLRRDLPPAAPASLTPHPKPPLAPLTEDHGKREGRVRSALRAEGAMAPKRAGTERPDRRVETLAPTACLCRGRGTARVRTPVCACSAARAGGSEGCARCAARATWLRTRRAKQKLHAVKDKKPGRAPAWQKKTSTRWNEQN